MRTSSAATATALSIIVVSACVAYQPDSNNLVQQNVHVLGKEKVSGSMQLMGDHLFNLTAMTTSSDVDDQALNRAVRRELGIIKGIAKGLGGSGQITNYSVISRYMGSFIHDVQVAEEFASRNPPNYVPANRLIKSCLSCHESFQ